MNRFKSFIEWNAFGVCTAIGDRLGISTSKIRQYFIYTSILTMGSPVISSFTKPSTKVVCAKTE